MLDILTFDLKDMGAGGDRILAMLAIVLAAIIVLMLRDFFVWFEGLSRQADEEHVDEEQADEDILARTGDAEAQQGVAAFIDRRHPANPATGFGRRQSDATVAEHRRAA